MLITEEQNIAPHRLMVIDDDQSVLAVLKYTLQKAGFKVFPYSNPLLALEAVPVEIPDLVLLDYKMPEMNGIDVLYKIRESDDTKIASIPVIMMSAAPSPALLQAIQTVKNVDFIEKPFVSQQLVQKVEFVISFFSQSPDTYSETDLEDIALPIGTLSEDTTGRVGGAI
jgi:DNA-binding response OmpR family regulator